MARGKGNRRGGGEEQDVDSDTSTVVTARSPGGKKSGRKGRGDESEEEEETTLSTHMDQLTEKRIAARTGALSSIIEMLRTQVMADEADECAVSLSESLLGCIKKGGSAEGCLAATALSLTFVTLAEEGAKLLEDVLPALGTQLKTNKHSAVRASVAEAIGVAVFSTGEGVQETLEVMGRLAKYFDEPKTVAVACIRAWGLLASAVPDGTLVLRMQELLRPLDALHDSTESEVRMAAAENVALLYEACWRHGGDEAQKYLGEEEGGEEEGSEVGEGEEEGGAGGEGGSVRRVKKAERVKERIAMRNAIKTVEGGAAAPVEKLKVKGVSVVVDTWREKRRLAALRGVLQGGFQAHMVWNELLHEVFSYDPTEKDTALEGSGVGQGTQKQLRQADLSRREKARKKVVGKGRSEKESGLNLVEGFSD